MSPLLLPKTRGIRREANFSGRPATAWGTSVVSDTVAHTLPATFTELIASTLFDTDWVNIGFTSNFASNTDTDSLVTLYVGAGGSEQVLIPTMLAGWVFTPSVTLHAPKMYGFPLRIPAGSRLSARHQSVRTSQEVRVMVELFGGRDHWVGTTVECLGAAPASSSGIFVTAGGASEGTFTSIGTNSLEWGFVQPMLGGNTDTTMAEALTMADLGPGVGVPIPGLDEFLFMASTTEYCWNIGGGRHAFVPRGTTLHLRSQCSGTAEAADWCIYGVA